MKQQLRDPNFLIATGAKFRRVRQMRGLTIETVLEDTKINVNRIEKGYVNITISTLSALLVYYDVTPAEFFSNGFEDYISSFINKESEEQ
ncbi:helix-turn-helix domain-containing protein [Flavobacterium sp. UBA4197]|uniref:helix-turn-helix domain-containing protein n=1 Tax=Flavobacterium sp. UBA4197 TaxID=1946546 RepID=UPI00258029CC|nr:helix-turn-helix transcriptional regulator [Flavobacterium sp. UBA4197]